MFLFFNVRMTPSQARLLALAVLPALPDFSSAALTAGASSGSRRKYMIMPITPGTME